MPGKRLTSDAPVGRIRATVRAGRDRMRATLLDWLPADCTARASSMRDAAPGLWPSKRLAAAPTWWRSTCPPPSWAWPATGPRTTLRPRTIDFRVGDMFDPALGHFDHVVAMDSLIHYKATDVVRVLDGFAKRSRHSMLFTFAPRSPALMLFWLAGKAFPRSDRSRRSSRSPRTPLRRAIARDPGLSRGLRTDAARGQRLLHLAGDGARPSMRCPVAASPTPGSRWGRSILPFADAATPELPLGRLLRLSLFQVHGRQAAVLVIGTLNA